MKWKCLQICILCGHIEESRICSCCLAREAVTGTKLYRRKLWLVHLSISLRFLHQHKLSYWGIQNIVFREFKISRVLCYKKGAFAGSVASPALFKEYCSWMAADDGQWINNVKIKWTINIEDKNEYPWRCHLRGSVWCGVSNNHN